MASAEKAHELVTSTVEKEIERVVYFHTSKAEADVPSEFAETSVNADWDPKEVVESIATMVKLSDDEKQSIASELKELSKDKEQLAHQRSNVIAIVAQVMRRAYDDAAASLGDGKRVMAIERGVLLRATDALWMQHLEDMTYLRRTIGLQGYAQRDPLVEYKREAFRLYGSMRQEIGREVAYNLYKVFDQAIAAKAMFDAAPQLLLQAAEMLSSQRTDRTTVVDVPAQEGERIPSQETTSTPKKQRPNDPCSCGSKKKYKKCHGK
jgi:preprotein translocase subunit SecA